MPPPVEPDESANPVDVRLLRAWTVATLAKPAANDLHEPEPMFGLRRSGEMGFRNERERHAVTMHAAPVNSTTDATRAGLAYFSSSFLPALRWSQFNIVLNTSA